MMTRALTKRELDDAESAGVLFKNLLRRTGDHEAVTALITLHPETALAALQYGDEALGLTPRGSADILEEVVSAVPDADKAQEMLRDHLTPERLRELIAARGDLPAVVTDIAGLDDILAAILSDISSGMIKPLHESDDPQDDDEDEDEEEDRPEPLEEKDEEDGDDGDHVRPSVRRQADLAFDASAKPFLILRSWAIKLRDREDFDDFLRMEIGHRTVREHLLIAIWHQAECPDKLAEIPPDLYDLFGIDPAEGREILAGLLDSDDVPAFTRDEFELARLDLTRRRERLDAAPTLAEEAKGKAADIAGKLEF